MKGKYKKLVGPLRRLDFFCPLWTRKGGVVRKRGVGFMGGNPRKKRNGEF